NQIGELPWGNCATFPFLPRHPCAALGIQPKGFLPREQCIFWIKPKATDCLSGRHPVEGNERVIAGDARRIRARSDRHAHFKHAPKRWRTLGGFRAIAIDEVFTLEGHAMLNCDPASERLDALDIPIRNRFAMIEEPVQPIERSIAVDLLENAKESVVRFFVGRMKPERPAILGKKANDALQLAFE